MPPHFHGGKAVNQRRCILPQPQALCRCSECMTFRNYDLASNTVVSGNLVSIGQWKNHQRRDETKRIALEHFHQNLNDKPSSAEVVRPPLETSPNSTTPSTPTVTCASSQSKNGRASQWSQPIPLTSTQYSGQSSDIKEIEDSNATPVPLPLKSIKLRKHGSGVLNRKQRRPHSKSTIGIESNVNSFGTQLASIRHRIREPITDTLQNIIQEQPLIFSCPPTKTCVLLQDQNLLGALELHPDAIENHAILDHEKWLSAMQQFIESQLEHSPGQLSSHDRILSSIIKKDIKREFEKVITLKKKEWQRQYDASPEEKEDSPPVIKTARFFSARTRLMEPITCLCYLLVAALHLLANTSIDDCTFALSFLSLIAKIALKDSMNVERFKISHSIPSDIRTVVRSLDIEPKSISFVCCSRCFCTYKIDPDNANSYPEFCTHQQTPRSRPCAARLQIHKPTGIHPVRRFLYQDLHEWIGRMYSRSDIEEYFDKYPNATQLSTSDELKDMWDGTILRDFCGLDNKPFFKGPGNEGRLVFGLNMDGFNPYSKKKGGKGVSIGGVYLVCFNLPPEIWYKTENIFLVGIIPRPTEPSVDQVNHVLRPLVDDLLVMWWKGIYITKTAKHPLGRPVRAAMLPLICDLPAARRASGHGSHSATHFCSECDISHKDINNLDTDTWTPRNLSDHHKRAYLWKNARTLQEQERIFSTYGIRWSELLRLPYWDPTKHVVIDPMHGFYLRMFHRHVRDIWGMDVTVADGDGASTSTYMDNLGEEEMMKADHLLRNGSLDQLKQLPLELLKYLCREAGLDSKGPYDKLVQLLESYRIKHRWFTDEGIHIPPSWWITENELRVPPLSHDPSIAISSSVSPSSSETVPLSSSVPLLSSVPPSSSLLSSVSSSLSPLLSTRPSSAVPTLSAPDPISTYKNNGPHTLEDHLDDIYKNGSKSAISTLKKDFLVTLCAMRFKRPATHYNGLRRPQIAQLVLDARDTDRAQNPQAEESVPKTSGSQLTKVLGRETLRAIREDMKRLGLPSYMLRAPKHPGEVKWGNFKADEWKSFCTVNLPITLTRLWGSKPKDDRHHKMLVNFMDLVTAVKLANSRTITEEKIILFDKHMRAYLDGIRKLYPASQITPYQHLSLHFAAQLRRFGPTHSWRCYAFERYNGIIQKIPTNEKLGEMEETMFRRFCQTQNLRVLFAERHLPPETHSIVDEFEKRYKVNIRGTILYDGSSRDPEDSERIQGGLKEGPMSKQIYASLRELISRIDSSKDGYIPNQISLIGAVERFGQLFQPMPHANNAHIMFQRSPDAPWSPGIIESLFTHKRWPSPHSDVTQTFAIVREYEELVEGHLPHDFYRKFTIAGGQLRYNQLLPKAILIPFKNVVTHVSHMPLHIQGIDRECIHVLLL